MSSIHPGLFPVRSLLCRCSSDDTAIEIEIEILVFIVSPDASRTQKCLYRCVGRGLYRYILMSAGTADPAPSA
ncbi:hypothetical protein DIE01_13940 [Burkholderia sp. Bp8990]|nr:hypothetical protein DIE01_13940 [Burkholderia sp. Bp8990]